MASKGAFQGLAAAGGLMSAAGSIFGANASADALDQQANAKRMQSDEIMKAAQRESGLSIRKGAAVRSSQAVGLGRSGVDVGSGSPLAMMAKTLSDAQEEATAILDAGRYRSATTLAEADALNEAADNARSAGILGAVGSIIGAGASIARGGL